MQLYNTMTRRKDTVRTSTEQDPLQYYSCGPTVYDHPHIGNWMAFIRYDILYRTLVASGHHVQWFMNLTDVGHLVSDADEGEDKLEKGAKREGKTAWEIADFYIDSFVSGLTELNISIPENQLPRATSAIKEQIELIQILEKRGHTYTIEDGVYFDTATLPDYGKLARLDTAELKEGARVAINAQKRNKTDFALWKFSPTQSKRDMEWDSPWGVGFPGWHIECSALAMKYLSESIDIHAGGIDHIPVHHTNEIAQSEAATGKTFAAIWFHSNFLTVNGVKLSKSLQNSFTLSDIKKKGYSPLDFRMLALQSHYRTQADFTWESLEAAVERRRTLQAFADLRFQEMGRYIEPVELESILEQVTIALEDDLNTPQALAALSKTDALLVAPDVEASVSDASTLTMFIEKIEQLFGLGLMQSKDITTAQKKLLEKRADARTQKKWEQSDSIRDSLASEGIAVLDTARGQRWERLPTTQG